MTTLQLFLVAFGSTVLLLLIILRVTRVRRPHTAGGHGLENYLVDLHYSDKAQDSPKEKGPSVRDKVKTLNSRSTRLRGFERELADADIPIYPVEWFTMLVAVGALLGYLISVKIGSPFGFVISFPLVYFVAGGVVGVRQTRRRREFDKQLGDTLLLLAGAMRAGYSFDHAMQSVAEEALEPVRGEFTRYCREVSLGLTTEAALVNMLRRNESLDLTIAVSAVQINRQVGGNLADVLEKIAETIRERFRIRQEIRTLTAQARLSGYIVAMIPVALTLFLNVVDPHYFAPMINSAIGITMLVSCAVFIGIGGLIIRSIVNIKI